ncbi:hypothetical protein ABFS83_08G226700 [Erythranthe nasuta]
MSTCSSGAKQGSSFGTHGGRSCSYASYPDYCRCGLKLEVKTSWTPLNPGRRFVTCPHRGDKGCKLFIWCDPEMCERSKQIIPGLLKKIDSLEAQLDLKTVVNNPYGGLLGYVIASVIGFCVGCFLLA